LKGRKLEKCISFLGSIEPVFERTTHVVGDKLVLKAIERHKEFPKRELKKFSRTGDVGVLV
jgi:hypothetical protein